MSSTQLRHQISVNVPTTFFRAHLWLLAQPHPRATSPFSGRRPRVTAMGTAKCTCLSTPTVSPKNPPTDLCCEGTNRLRTNGLRRRLWKGRLYPSTTLDSHPSPRLLSLSQPLSSPQTPHFSSATTLQARSLPTQLQEGPACLWDRSHPSTRSTWALQ